MLGSANENFDPSLYLIGPYLKTFNIEAFNIKAFNIEAFRLKTFNIAFIVYNQDYINYKYSVYLDCRALMQSPLFKI